MDTSAVEEAMQPDHLAHTPVIFHRFSSSESLGLMKAAVKT